MQVEALKLTLSSPLQTPPTTPTEGTPVESPAPGETTPVCVIKRKWPGFE
jgi:hypothetical protein